MLDLESLEPSKLVVVCAEEDLGKGKKTGKNGRKEVRKDLVKNINR